MLHKRNIIYKKRKMDMFGGVSLGRLISARSRDLSAFHPIQAEQYNAGVFFEYLDMFDSLSFTFQEDCSQILMHFIRMIQPILYENV